jgi:uncharacterized protein
MNLRGATYLALALLLALQACTPERRPAKVPKFIAPVLDEAEVISAADEALMNNFARVLQKRTGAQIAVYTVPTLSGQEPAMFATETAEAWGGGTKAEDNGVLVLVVPGDRKDHTATGRGVEGVLPDSLVGSLRRKFLVPAFKSGDFGGGLRQYLYELGVRIASESEREPGQLSKDFAQLLGVKGATNTTPTGTQKQPRKRRKQSWLNWLFLGFIFLTMIGGGLRGRRRYGFWGAMMMTSGMGRSGARSSGGFGGGFGGGGGSFGGGGAGGSW